MSALVGPVLMVLVVGCGGLPGAEPAEEVATAVDQTVAPTQVETTDPVATDPAPAATDPDASDPAPTAPAATEHVVTEPPLPEGVARPDWLHTRPLPLGPNGYALPQPTPEELVTRRIPTIDLLPPPADGVFASTIAELSDEIVARSTWTEECPVTRDELRYVQMSFWGFDDRPHTGEIIVNARWAGEIVEIFRGLYDARYPIEEMRVVRADELDGPPTGDTNNTSAFVCRPVRGSTTWSQHAFGLAVDINPFINPYQKGDRILPELAGSYLDRAHVRPGMLAEGHEAVEGFDALGWGWGGRWNSLIDWMHFSANGR